MGRGWRLTGDEKLPIASESIRNQVLIRGRISRVLLYEQAHLFLCSWQIKDHGETVIHGARRVHSASSRCLIDLHNCVLLLIGSVSRSESRRCWVRRLSLTSRVLLETQLSCGPKLLSAVLPSDRQRSE